MFEKTPLEMPNERLPRDRIRCPVCADYPRLTQSFRDIRSGKLVRVYQCQCDEPTWDD
jgi:hypothetical protein